MGCENGSGIDRHLFSVACKLRSQNSGTPKKMQSHPSHNQCFFLPFKSVWAFTLHGMPSIILFYFVKWCG